MRTDLDEALVRKAQEGDRAAFGELYDRYRARLFGYLLKLAHDPALAEDLFQETWMKTLHSIAQFDPNRGGFKPWLYRIATNTLRDRMRHRSVRQGPELDAFSSEGEGERHIDHVASADPDPERQALGRLAKEDVNTAIQALPDGQRAAVLLRFQQGLTFSEIAASLDSPVGTVKAHVHRAVKALRKALPEWTDE